MGEGKHNAERFTGRVEDYARYRQRYPAEPVLALLRAWCGLRVAHVVADVGAGTGMLAEVFLANGNAVIAVEPNAEMRAACEALTVQWPRLRVIEAAAEDTGLDAASIDLVAVGRAFHWFDVPRALAEFRRVLKPGGWVALLSAGRAKNAGAISVEYERVLDAHTIDPTHKRAGHNIHEGLDGLFDELHQTQMHGEQQLTWDEFLGQTMSLSSTPREGHPLYAETVQALAEFFTRYAVDGVIAMPTTCWVSCGRFATP